MRRKEFSTRNFAFIRDKHRIVIVGRDIFLLSLV